MEVQGARSIEERFEGEPNAQEVAEAWKAEGFKGCWVLALGTNEAANVAAGSTVGVRERIEKMMAIIGDEPVLWVNVRSLVPPGDPYSKEGMDEVGRRTRHAPARPTPTCASTTGPQTSKTNGSSKTASTSPRPATPPAPQLIAQALAHAFPAKGETEGGAKHCVAVTAIGG